MVISESWVVDTHFAVKVCFQATRNLTQLLLFFCLRLSPTHQTSTKVRLWFRLIVLTNLMAPLLIHFLLCPCSFYYHPSHCHDLESQKSIKVRQFKLFQCKWSYQVDLLKQFQLFSMVRDFFPWSDEECPPLQTFHREFNIHI